MNKKMIRVVIARAESPAGDHWTNALAVRSEGLGNIIHIIGGAGEARSAGSVSVTSEDLAIIHIIGGAGSLNETSDVVCALGRKSS